MKEPYTYSQAAANRLLELADKENADLRARCEKAEKDAERIAWLEAQHTLHGAVEFLYVVIGYEAQLTYDGNPRGPKFQADTLRGAIDSARAYI